MLRLIPGLLLRCLIFSLTVLVLSVMAAFWYINDYLETPLSGAYEPHVIEVPSGSSLTKLAHQMADQELLKHPVLFTAYARLIGQTNIRVGEYQLDPGVT
ncbi:MAG: UPF0755 protein, partial [Porticoccus sp.]